jgi:hypothetical protein
VVPTRSRVVTAAAAARPLNGASCWPNAPAEKWSLSSSTSTPLSSTCRAKSSQARPWRTDSLTTPNRNLAMLRHAIAAGSPAGGAPDTSNAEITLARALDGHYARAGDEGYALIREALTISGDICPGPGELLIRLDPLTAPRRTHALAALCDQLSQAQACYPGTDLVLRYEVKPHP